MNQDKIARKVLVVDDDPHLLNLMEIRLLGEGFNVTVASSAADALNKVASETPDLVIADIMMPGLDGYQLCEKIRANQDLKNIPFIFLSALADTQDKVKGLKLGADDYLTKPFEFHELLARIEILLDRYSRYQQTFTSQTDEAIATSGNIEDLGVIDLLQMLSFGQKTGEVQLESGGEEGYLYLAAGKLIAAIYRNKQGSDALPNLLSWSQGRFRIKLSDSLSVIPTIQHQTDEAIFEALRVLDEAERIKQELDPDAVPSFVKQYQAASDDEKTLVELLDGKRDLKHILAESPLSDFRTLQTLEKLVGEEIVALAGAGQAPAIASQQEFNLIVVGSDRDERNAFIHSVSGEKGKEKALNFGSLKLGSTQLNLYGLPGAKRFAPLWQTFTPKVQGILLLAKASSEEEVSNLRFAISLLRNHVVGPAIVVNTDPTHPEISLGDEAKGIKVIACLPSDRTKAEEILTELIIQLNA